ncbi:MAG: hypothetical protein GY952_14785 [Rhodobacteraceae bacterium]|nr:hypothetical protein [Paracoccaceae bacterium]
MTLDFDVFAPGHGGEGDKSDLEANLVYVQELSAGVLAALRSGKSVKQIQTELTLDAYADWGQYESWRVMNIEGMARYLQSTGKEN